MTHNQLNRLYLFFLLLLHGALPVYSQNNLPDVKQWSKMLGRENAPVTNGISDVFNYLKDKDSVTASGILNKIEKSSDSRNNYFKARFCILKAKWLREVIGDSTKKYENQITQFLKQSLNAAYETNNDSLIAEVAWTNGLYSYYDSKTEPAAMYCLFAAEMDEKSGRKTTAYNCWFLGAILYQTRDYERAIHYTLLSIEQETDTSADTKRFILSRYNTIGLCYQRMGKIDSAFVFYDKAMAIANVLKNTLWIGIISGNKGQIYFAQKKYALAKSLLRFDYNTSKISNEESSAANSLQWIARISLAEGKKDSALAEIKEALELINVRADYSTAFYKQNIFFTAAEVYRSLGKNDSVVKYSGLYNLIHDSIERAVADSRIEISRIKLNNLQNMLAIKNLQKEKEANILKRNFLVLAIVLVAVIIILIVNRQKQKLVYKKREAEHEADSARQQMELFKQNIIEKTSLIEKLQEQVQDKEISAEQYKIIEEITQQTILTEDDWERFKKLFEKIYPGFFTRLKEKTPDITLAEQRMAALIRLHITNKQIAAMLGISIAGVNKTRQRLRQRFNLTAETNMEEYIAAL